MSKKIYISEEGAKALRDLQSTGDYKGINFSEKPSSYFPYEVRISDDSIGETDEGYLFEDQKYHPDRDACLDDTIETIEKTTYESNSKKKTTTRTPKESKLVTLAVENFENPLFDKILPRRHSIQAREKYIEEIKSSDDYQRELWSWGIQHDDDYGEESFSEPPVEEAVINGVTMTNDSNKVGFTYFEIDGRLEIHYWKDKNVLVYEGIINSTEDFNKAMKRADRNISKL